MINRVKHEYLAYGKKMVENDFLNNCLKFIKFLQDMRKTKGRHTFNVRYAYTVGKRKIIN